MGGPVTGAGVPCQTVGALAGQMTCAQTHCDAGMDRSQSIRPLEMSQQQHPKLGEGCGGSVRAEAPRRSAETRANEAVFMM